jgi:hypothetical protein
MTLYEAVCSYKGFGRIRKAFSASTSRMMYMKSASKGIDGRRTQIEDEVQKNETSVNMRGRTRMMPIESAQMIRFFVC